MPREPGTPYFPAVPAAINLPAAEREILQRWRDNKGFDRSLERTAAGALWTFYEGPPTANGMPGGAPHRGPGLQGRFPSVQDHGGLLRAPPGRLGLPWPAGGGGGREGAGPVGKEGHRGVRDRRLQPALP